MKIYIAYILLISMAFSCVNTEQVRTVNYRPKYHYTPAKNWVNDPNGMVYLDGEYHLFYQYNPEGDLWGHMSWGHAISTDLQNWEELPVALPEIINEDGSKEGIFSGSAVVDSLNTSGFFEPGFKNGLVAIYTANITLGEEQLNQNQGIAYSSDKGRTWQYYDQNPVLDIGLKDFRDPNVMWWPSEQKWIMTVVKPLDFIAQFYESKDLTNWTLMSEFGKMGDTTKIWECPSLVKVPIENSKEEKWVLMISSGHKSEGFVGMQYFVGEFDGHTFSSQNQNEIFSLDDGKDFYAAIPFNGLPEENTKPIIMGWLNNWAYAKDIPLQGSRGGFSFPRELSLYQANGQFKLKQNPIVNPAIETFKENINLASLEEPLQLDPSSNVYKLDLNIDLTNTNGFDLDILKTEVNSLLLHFDKSTGIFSVDRTKSGLVDFNPNFASIEKAILDKNLENLKVEVYVDQSVVEIYLQDGAVVLTELVFPKVAKTSIELTKQ